jgi:Zn-dependent alcohol dehydrogenase
MCRESSGLGDDLQGARLIQAAALPLVTTTGNQLLSATGIEARQTVMVVGAAGNVGRSAVFTAKERGATVIARVLKRQTDEAKTVGADQVVATDDDTAIANLPPLDAVADTTCNVLRKTRNDERLPQPQSRFETKWRRMCRMPGVIERLVVSSPSVCGVWAHRLL